jgi:2-iminobutanoate/2-iminopropanoate deaminase
MATPSPLSKTPLSTSAAPKAIGPYSQGVESRGARTLWLSGQIPLDPATGELVKGTIQDETARVMENLRAVLAAGGAGFEHVVRCTIFLADLGDFAAVNEVYGRFFPAQPPARATVQVAGLPRGARVEIDAVAVLD